MDKYNIDNRQMEYIISIKEDVAAIKQHLADINGKIVKHEKQLSETCPLRHSDLDKNMTIRRNEINKRLGKIEVRMAKWGGAFTVVNGVMVFVITNWDKIKLILGGE